MIQEGPPRPTDVQGNFWKIDPHSHSERSDGRNSYLERALLAKLAGLDGFGETDHDVPANPEEIYDELIPRLKGIETTTAEGHTLAYAPDGTVIKKIPMAHTLVETVRRMRGEGYKIILPHSNYLIVPGSASTSAIKRVYDAGFTVDGMEVEHTFFKDRHRNKAYALADELGVAMLGTTDDHTGNIGRRFYTLVPKLTDDPIADFYTALENRTTIPVKSEMDLLPTPKGKNALRHVTALFDGLPSKIVTSPRLARNVVTYYAKELIGA